MIVLAYQKAKENFHNFPIFLNISWHIFPAQLAWSEMIANKMHLISLQNQSMQYHTVNYNTMYDVQCTKTNNFVINAKFQKGIILIS